MGLGVLDPLYAYKPLQAPLRAHNSEPMTLRRRVNARRESARIAAEAEKHGIRGTSGMRTRLQTKHTCSRISPEKLRKSRFRPGGGLHGFFE